MFFVFFNLSLTLSGENRLSLVVLNEVTDSKTDLRKLDLVFSFLGEELESGPHDRGV